MLTADSVFIEQTCRSRRVFAGIVSEEKLSSYFTDGLFFSLGFQFSHHLARIVSSCHLFPFKNTKRTNVILTGGSVHEGSCTPSSAVSIET